MNVAQRPSADSSRIDIDAWRRRIRDDTLARYHREMGVALSREEPAAAADAFKRALAILPDDSVSARGLVLALRAIGQEAEALAVDGRARAENPDYWTDGAFAMGHGAWESGRRSDALALYREVAEAKPDHEEARDCVGLCLAQGNDWDAARAIYDAVAPRPGWRSAEHIGAAHIGLGAILLAQNDRKHGEAETRRGLAIDPDNVTGLRNLGALLGLGTSPGTWEEALVMLERANQLMPGMLEITRSLSELLLRMGQADRAEPLFRELLDRGAANVNDRFLLAMLLVSARRYAEAEAVARAAVDAAPRDPLAHIVLGEKALAVGEPETAMAAFRSALELAPPTAGHGLTVLPLRAFAAWSLGRLGEAEADVGVVLRSTRNDRALANFGLIRYRQGQVDEALSLLKEAGEAAPGNKSWPFVCLAAVLYDLGREAEGDAALARAYQTQPITVGTQIDQHRWARAALEAGARRLGFDLSPEKPDD